MSSSTYEGKSKYTGEADSSQQRGESKQQPESSTAKDGKMGKREKRKVETAQPRESQETYCRSSYSVSTHPSAFMRLPMT